MLCYLRALLNASIIVYSTRDVFFPSLPENTLTPRRCIVFLLYVCAYKQSDLVAPKWLGRQRP